MILLSALPAHAADWAAYSSDNFTIYSDARKGEISRLIAELELLREIALMLLDFPDEPEDERLRIFVFDQTLERNRIASYSSELALTVSGPSILVAAQSYEDRRESLFYSYIRNRFTRLAVNFPSWYQVGLAQLLATVEFDKDSIVVGTPPVYYSFDPRPVRDVIQRPSDPSDYDNPFFETAWLLTHHILIDSVNGNTERARQTVDYFRRYDAGADAIEAFVESYGVSPEEMQEELKFAPHPCITPRCEREPSGRYDVQFKTLILDLPEYSGEVSRRALVDGEDFYVLGDIAVERAVFTAAHKYFDSFDGLQIESPLSSKVASRRAVAYVYEERISEGDAIIEELLTGNVEDIDVLADIAHYEYRRYEYASQHEESTAFRHLTRSIEFGERALAAAPTHLEAAYYLGLAYESKGDLQPAADSLMQIYDVYPTMDFLNLQLARVLVKGKQIELASYLISRVYGATSSSVTRERLRDVQRQIEEGDFDIESIDDLL